MADPRHALASEISMTRSGSLIVLGASADQRFMIRTARAMGLHVVAVDRNPSAPAFADADESAVVSTRDREGLRALADALRERGHVLRGVTTMGSDIPDVIADLADHLGTPGPSRRTAHWATDKAAMKERFAAQGIPIPWFEAVRSFEPFESVVRRRGLPVVLKPIDRSGSRGVFLCEDRASLRALFDRSLAMSHAGVCLVEEYLEGSSLDPAAPPEDAWGVMLEVATALEAVRAQAMEFADKYFKLVWFGRRAPPEPGR